MGAISLPTRRDEAWKYSDLRAAFGDAPVPDEIAERAGHPIIVQLAAAAGALDHVALWAGESAVRIERMEAPAFEAKALQIDLAPGASLTRVVIQDGAAVALNLVRVKLAAGSVFRQFVLAFGSKLARLETHIDVEGENASVALHGVYLCGAGRHCDLTSQVTHKVANGRTRQLIKGAARQGGRGVFQGKILVATGAQKTDAEQHHDALLLAEGAEIYAKPELEIHADDVACAHGNTIGALDEQALFYMRQRGAPKAQAQSMLVDAFLRDAIPHWLPEAAAADVDQRIAGWLEGQS
jgi:Fe-S cluster assembly protein SufD